MTNRRPLRTLIPALTVSLLLSLVAYGQTSASRISGTVTDSSGAVVPGAKVTARDEATGATYTQLTGSTGLYGFPSLPAGRYTIIVEVKSFKTINKTGNVLEVGTGKQPASFNLRSS